MKPIFRIVTASSLFDGHDASINVYRRLFQKEGLEVIHIGHNRSVEQIVHTAIQEDVDAVCISSYQGGHIEYFKFLRDSLNSNGGKHICIFGGGGGTILPSEIKELEDYGITKLYHANDGRKLGLNGIIQDAVSRIKKNYETEDYYRQFLNGHNANKALGERDLSKILTFIEEDELHPSIRNEFLETVNSLESTHKSVIIGLTGPGGAGKSSLVDELLTRYLYSSKNGRVAILAFDPSKRKTGGALLGDRIRMNAIYNDRVFLRSMATRLSGSEVGSAVKASLNAMKLAHFDLIILETTGIGQGDASVIDLVDHSLYVMTSEYGASSQLEKIDMIDYADMIVLNKFDKIGAEDAYDDVLHAYAHARDIKAAETDRSGLPIFKTIASDFNNAGVSKLYISLIKALEKKNLLNSDANKDINLESIKKFENPYSFTIIPPEKTFYLNGIVEVIRQHHSETEKKAEIASAISSLKNASQHLSKKCYTEEVESTIAKKEKDLGPNSLALIQKYSEFCQSLKEEKLSYTIRNKTFTKDLFHESLSGLAIPKIAIPRYQDWGDILRFMRQENFPGHYPYTAGVFQLKNEEEDPKRQFAGEGSPQRTNKRFHYLCRDDNAKRLSTAFDSVTLYGEDPSEQMDIYGKIGNSGVSIASLNDMKALYNDFDLLAPLTSVSLTINGPAPIILAMFLNTAIDFEVKKKTGKERCKIDSNTYQCIKKEVLKKVRGTVQADILKEEQAQNTCIFSSKFAIKMMGDIQEYFIQENVRNFYSVSISGYHIAEAGANPISQLAFTLANGFTLVEYYLSRGMHIDDFAPSLSFFFSCGLDPEYAVIGRVARRIWAIALREKYGANERSSKLKYHIQTSGRSLHAQEIAFNDIRTTLQALLAVYDNCNSLHTNAYDEAITTPTEESVRRAMAIQMILAKEFGAAKCQNTSQGSFFYNELTDLVEEAVLTEFDSLSRRGGVLGAMEKQYQRHRIQTESMKYEMLKGTGELPIVGVNTFINEENESKYENIDVIRASDEEKQEQIRRVETFIESAGEENSKALQRLQVAVLSGENIFEELMETVKYCSLGQITHLLYTCGGEYRRSM
jgi:methylmalonyl-CoA mutase